MRCSDFHDRINELMDARMEPAADARIQCHAQECDTCRAALVGYRMLQQFYASAAPPVRPRTSRAQRSIVAVLASAAIVLLAVSLSRSIPSATPMASPDVANVAYEAPPLLGPQATDPVLVDVQAGQSAAAGSVMVQPILGLTMVAKTDWTGLESVRMPFGMQVPQLETQWLRVVADEMQPVRQSVDNTVSLIIRTLST